MENEKDSWTVVKVIFALLFMGVMFGSENLQFTAMLIIGVFFSAIIVLGVSSFGKKHDHWGGWW